MELIRHASAGTLESGDILIEIEPREDGGLVIELESAVESQFGEQIRRVIRQTAGECGIGNAWLRALDKGALDCTVRARVQAAVCRGAGETYDFARG